MGLGPSDKLVDSHVPTRPNGPERPPATPVAAESADRGYDAERACGELRVTFLPGKSAQCKCTVSCTAVYGLEGKRRFNGGQ